MRFACSLLLLGLVLQVAAAAPPEVQIVPPSEPDKWTPLTAAANRLLVLKAEPASVWQHVGDGACDWRTFENGKLAAICGGPGKYRFTVTSPAGEVSRIEVTLSGDIVPPKPEPIDTLVKELRELYQGEPAATRKADMAALAALYTLMVDECASPAYTTAAQLNAKFLDARDRMLRDPKKPDDPPRLPLVRKRCGQEVLAVIGDNPDAALTDGSRKVVAAVYARLAQAVTEAAK